MFCSRCGKEVEKSSQFCPSCGLDLRVTTPVQAIATGDVTELDIVREALSAEYELLEELGRGGMAIVYRAREKTLEREVAIKVLPFSLAFDAEFVERFQREARTAAQLEHPNIIPIYRVGKAGRVIFFVMKMLRGQSLSRLLYDRRKLPPAEIRRILIEAGSALGYAHTRGIVHRDIKPDNIMFDEFGQVVVTDFGIAKAASGARLTGTGMSIGTPHYMSPEQARAQAIDGRSDIYGLGIVAYQALVGEVPFDGEDSFAIGYKHIMEPIPTPALPTADERRLFEVIRRMIAKDPAERFQTTDELIFVLDEHPMLVTSGGRTTARHGVSTLPTSPMPAVEPRASRPGESRRPVGRRPVGHREGQGSALRWLLPLGLVLAAGGGYMALKPGEASAPVAAAPSNDSTLVVPAPGDSAVIEDSLRVPDSATPAAPQPDSARTSVLAVSDPPAAPQPVRDSGAIRLTGLPSGSAVLIDGQPRLEPVIRLAAGPHELGITAPRHQFFRDTIIIMADRELVMSPELTPLVGRPGARQRPAQVSCDNPSLANRYGRACYDKPPIAVGPTRVALPAGFEGTPRQSVMLVLVSAEGTTLRVVPFNPSDNSQFEQLALNFARGIHWRPAVRKGAPVDGWTQFVVAPQ